MSTTAETSQYLRSSTRPAQLHPPKSGGGLYTLYAVNVDDSSTSALRHSEHCSLSTARYTISQSGQRRSFERGAGSSWGWSVDGYSGLVDVRRSVQRADNFLITITINDLRQRAVKSITLNVSCHCGTLIHVKFTVANKLWQESDGCDVMSADREKMYIKVNLEAWQRLK